VGDRVEGDSERREGDLDSLCFAGKRARTTRTTRMLVMVNRKRKRKRKRRGS
jgi:hypothetical protein